MVNKISILIPCFQERWRLPVTLSEIFDFTRRYPGIIGEVIIVDDGSTDQTIFRALRYKDKLPLTLAQHTVNKGKWAAIRTGMEIAKNKYILLLDADGSASVRELERIGIDYMKEYVLRTNIALFGSRFLPESTVDGKSNFRRIISKGYRMYVRILYWWATGKTAPDDMQCPFKLFPKDQLLFDIKSKMWAGDIELAGALKCNIVDVPVNFVHKGGSKIAKNTIWTMFITTAKSAMYVRRELRELRDEQFILKGLE